MKNLFASSIPDLIKQVFLAPVYSLTMRACSFFLVIYVAMAATRKEKSKDDLYDSIAIFHEKMENLEELLLVVKEIPHTMPYSTTPSPSLLTSGRL